MSEETKQTETTTEVTKTEGTNEAPFPEPSTGPAGDAQNEEAQQEERADDSDDSR